MCDSLPPLATKLPLPHKNHQPPELKSPLSMGKDFLLHAYTYGNVPSCETTQMHPANLCHRFPGLEAVLPFKLQLRSLLSQKTR